MNVSSELNYIINSLNRLAGPANVAYQGMSITQKINVIYRLSRKLNFPTTTVAQHAYNTASEMDAAIYNMVAVAGSIGAYHVLSLNQKINYAYRMARRLDNMVSSIGGDTDATNWINQLAANGATQDSTHQGYINTLVTGLKTDNLWTHIFALWVPIFGSAAANKWNIKNSVDSDPSFRLTFTGNWTYNANGSVGDGSTAFADTHFNTLSSGASLNTFGFGSYSRGGAVSYIMGNDDFTNLNILQANTTQLFGTVNSTSLISAVTVTPTRLLYYERPDSTHVKIYRDGTLASTQAINSSALPNMNIYLGALNFTGGTQFGIIPSAMYMITDGSFLDADVTNLTNRVNTFMTSWGINV